MDAGHIGESNFHFDVESGRTTTLHKAAKTGNFNEILQLSNLSAKVKSTTEDGQTPLHESAIGGHPQVARYLLKKGASVNAQDNAKQTPLHWSVLGNSKDVLKLLIKKGACVNAPDKKSQTPLHMSAQKGLIDITECLLKFNALLDFRDEEGQTPLHLAVRQGHLKVTKILLANGASVDVKDNYNCTAEKLAWLYGHDDLAGVIRRRGINRSSDELDTVQRRPVPERSQWDKELACGQQHYMNQTFVRGRMNHSKRAAMHTGNSARMSLKEAASRLSSSTSSLLSLEDSIIESELSALTRSKSRSGSMTKMQVTTKNIQSAEANASLFPKSNASDASRPNRTTTSSSNGSIIPTVSQLQDLPKLQVSNVTTSSNMRPSYTSNRPTQTCKTPPKTSKIAMLSFETVKTPSCKAETQTALYGTTGRGQVSSNTSEMCKATSNMSKSAIMDQTPSYPSNMGRTSLVSSGWDKSSSSTSEENNTLSGTSRSGHAPSVKVEVDTVLTSSNMSRQGEVSSNRLRRKKSLSRSSQRQNDSLRKMRQGKTSVNAPRAQSAISGTSDSKENSVNMSSQDSMPIFKQLPIRTSKMHSTRGDTTNLLSSDEAECERMSLQDRVRLFEQLGSPENETNYSGNRPRFRCKRSNVSPTPVNRDGLPSTPIDINSSASHTVNKKRAPSWASDKNNLQTMQTGIVQTSKEEILQTPVKGTSQPKSHVTVSSLKPENQTLMFDEINKNVLSKSNIGSSKIVHTFSSNTPEPKFSSPRNYESRLSFGSNERTPSTAKKTNATLTSRVSPLRPPEEVNGIHGNVRDSIRVFQSPVRDTTTESTSQKKTVLHDKSLPPEVTKSKPQISGVAGQHYSLREVLAPLEEILQGRSNVIVLQMSPTYNTTTLNVENADNVVNNGTMKIVRDPHLE